MNQQITIVGLIIRLSLAQSKGDIAQAIALITSALCTIIHSPATVNADKKALIGTIVESLKDSNGVIPGVWTVKS